MIETEPPRVAGETIIARKYRETLICSFESLFPAVSE